MRILTSLDAFKIDPAKPLILGLGNFDGLHLGHQALIQHVLEQARLLGGTAAVLTFQNHPQQILHPSTKPPLLLPADYKLFLLKEMGLNLCLWLPFTEQFSKIKARDFVTSMLVEQLGVKEVCMGYNAFFGYQREGNTALMQALAKEFRFRFEKIEPIRAAGDFVSSSRIRELVRKGELDKAAICLGRPFRLWGQVVKGEGRGRVLGFPTANLKLGSEVLPSTGVYPVHARVLELDFKKGAAGAFEDLTVSAVGPWQAGVLNYGSRPTWGKGAKPQAEVYLLDFAGDLYGKHMEVCLYGQLREEKAFEGAEALKKQIAEDVKQTRAYFKADPGAKPLRLS
jgi:riboflavin kinase/FMN adenylyltransferase